MLRDWNHIFVAGLIGINVTFRDGSIRHILYIGKYYLNGKVNNHCITFRSNEYLIEPIVIIIVIAPWSQQWADVFIYRLFIFCLWLPIIIIIITVIIYNILLLLCFHI